jgi:predicted nuclease with TOPRIM domain
VGAKARARRNLDESLRKFDKLSRDKEELELSKREKIQKLKEKEEANEPLRNQAEELAQQLNRKQDEVVSILREMEDLQSQFQSTDKYDYLINWQNKNAQTIIDNSPYFFWVNDSRKNPHFRLVKNSDREMKT